MSWKIFALLLVLIGFSSAQCAASIFNRPTKPPIVMKTVPWTFNIKLKHHNNEIVGLTGEGEELGNWKVNSSILLTKSKLPNMWFTTVGIPKNKLVFYRYFTCLVDSLGNRQIKYWESQIEPRRLETQEEGGEVQETFGVVGDEKKIQRGWLTKETAIQFKLLNNPFAFKEPIGDRKLLIKLEPVDYVKETFHDIMPSARANAEYARYEYGNSNMKRQPTYGVPLENDDSLVFMVTVADPSTVAYRLKVMFYEEDKPEVIRLFGYQFINPELLVGTEGSFLVNLISPLFLSTIGNVVIDYVVVTPLPTPELNFHSTFSNYWRHNWTRLDIGHRGLGKSLTVATNAAPVTENTVASMKQSVLEGADAVEFDVQLTKDLIPVIYHDFYIYMCLKSQTPTTKDDLTQVHINELTYEQLKSVRTYQVVSNKVIEYPSHNSEPRKDHRLFPLLEEFFEEIDQSVGFDIEIKWPQMKQAGMEANQTIDKNLYTDTIIDTILRKGCGRFIFITSFDADICTMFRIKQNIYPVAFLSPTNSTFIDPRSITIKDAVNHAQAFDLIGVVPHTSHIVRDPSQVQLVFDIGKEIFVWGNVNNQADDAFFKSLNVTALIYDRIDVIIPDDKNSSIFRDEAANGFFNLQCLDHTFGDPNVEEAEATPAPKNNLVRF